jgi:hypothetical protein
VEVIISSDDPKCGSKATEFNFMDMIFLCRLRQSQQLPGFFVGAFAALN